MLRDLLANAWNRVPSHCAVCRRWPARALCDPCIARFAQPVPRCSTCALPVPAGIARCGACISTPPPLDACLAAVHWGYPWSGCIAAFKFAGQAGSARMLAQLLRSVPWAEPALDACDLVLPVPLSVQRLRDRGFNQALELARHLAPRRTDASLLLRLRDTPPQRALDRAARMLNVRGAFAVAPLRAGTLRGRRVVLVDDVMTSGASLHAAASALRAAGTAHITALVVARAE